MPHARTRPHAHMHARARARERTHARTHARSKRAREGEKLHFDLRTCTSALKLIDEPRELSVLYLRLRPCHGLTLCGCLHGPRRMHWGSEWHWNMPECPTDAPTDPHSTYDVHGGWRGGGTQIMEIFERIEKLKNQRIRLWKLCHWIGLDEIFPKTPLPWNNNQLTTRYEHFLF